MEGVTIPCLQDNFAYLLICQKTGEAAVVDPSEADPVRKEILLLQQFRAGVVSRYDDDYLYEIVAGIIDKNESPKETAKRECVEETGCKVNKITPINEYFPAPGSSESYYHLYFAEIDSFDGNKILGQESENEDILVCSYTLEQIKDLIKNKKIINAATLIALQWFFSELDKN